MNLWKRQRRVGCDRDHDDGDGSAAAGRCTEAPEVTTAAAAAATTTPPKSAKQELAIAAKKAKTGRSATGKNAREKDGERGADASTGLNTETTARATMTMPAVKLPPGGVGVEEAKISFGDLGNSNNNGNNGNGSSASGGGGNGIIPTVSPQVAESGAGQGGSGGGGGRVLRQRDTGPHHNAPDVLETLKHLPKLFLKDIMAQRCACFTGLGFRASS